MLKQERKYSVMVLVAYKPYKMEKKRNNIFGLLLGLFILFVIVGAIITFLPEVTKIIGAVILTIIFIFVLAKLHERK
jgi:hypothetical protein